MSFMCVRSMRCLFVGVLLVKPLGFGKLQLNGNVIKFR